MASVIDICNLALAHIGDNATISSIDPPEGSTQAGHCKLFYPIARDALLELHDWKFASKHKVLALYNINNYAQWNYAYTLPPDFIKAVAITREEATHLNMLMPHRELIDYAIELDENDNLVLYTQIDNAFLRYQSRIIDATKYSPLFVTSLSWYLASLLAGVVVKGEEGFKQTQRCLEVFYSFLAQATASDANQGRSSVAHVHNNYGGLADVENSYCGTFNAYR